MSAQSTQLRRALRRELSVHFPPDQLEGPFLAEDAASAELLGFKVVDAVVRKLAPAVFAAQDMPGAAEGFRSIPPFVDKSACLKGMMEIEKVARKHEPPNTLVRALGGAASTAAMLADGARNPDEEKSRRSVTQFAAACGRVVSMSVPLVPDKRVLLGALIEAL